MEKFDEYLNESHGGSFDLISVLNNITVKSKYNDFFDVMSDLNNLGEGIKFMFLSNNYSVEDYGKSYQKIHKEFKDIDGHVTNIELDDLERARLYTCLEIATSFKNEVGATEHIFLKSIYDPIDSKSFWKQAIERSKVHSTSKQDLVNMADNFSDEFSKDLTEDEKNYIKPLTIINKYNMFELKTFEDFDFEEDENIIVDDWLESNNFYDDMGLWSCDSTFTIVIPDYLINEDGFLKVSFGTIGGGFDISDVNLKTLKGCPKEVKGDFGCTNTHITNLDYLPNKIMGGLYLIRNKLENIENLKNAIIGKYINISYNKLTNLEGCPYIINGSFKCSNNLLSSLDGGPIDVPGDFDCSNNLLLSLNGAPRSVLNDVKIDNAGDITETEEKFYKSKKGYNNYYDDLLKWIIDNDRTETDLDNINWPKDFIQSNDNALKSIKTINKFGLGIIKND